MKQAEPVKRVLHSPDRQVESRPRGPMAIALLISAVGLLTLAVHWPVLTAQAVSFDDNVYLFENPLLQQPGWYSISRFFREVFKSSTVEGYYEPLTLTSLMLDVALGGRADHLRQFHRTSLALHVLNTALIIILLYQLFGHPWAAALAGLLFGLHPLTVEPVAWVWERKTLLATFFVLWSLISYVSFARRRSRFGYVFSLMTFVLSLLAKPTGTPLPILLLLLDYWPLKRLNQRAIFEKLPFFVLAGVSAAITIISTARNAGVQAPTGRSLIGIVLQVCYLLAFYLAKIVWPANLSSAYAPPRPLSWANPAVLGAVVMATLLTIALIASWRRTRAVVTGAGFFVIAIAPMLGIIGYSWVIASDKYVYLPALGLLLILAWAIQRMNRVTPERSPLLTSLTILVLLAIAAGEAVGTRRYLTSWQDTETLYRRMVRISPDTPGPHNNLAAVLLGKGRVQGAIEQAREALRIDPNHVGAYVNLGNALMREGQIENAIAAYEKALDINPNYARAHNNLGLSLYRRGRVHEAIEHYSRAIQSQPEYAEAYRNRGAALLRLDRFEQAAESFREAIRIRPNLAEAHAGLGHALIGLGREPDALAEYAQALRLDPHLAEAHQQIATILTRRGRMAEAITHYRETLQSQPDSVLALNNLAWILATNPDPALRDGAGAVELAERACRISLNQDAGTLDTLAAAYAATGEFSKAIESIRRAIELAHQAQDRSLLNALTDRLKLYETGQVFLERQ